MGQSYVGEIRAIGFTYAPSGWLFCQGQLLSISEYATLYTLLGTTYGGDGQTTFALPDLRGRAPVHQGSAQSAAYPLGLLTGQENVTLNTSQVAVHSHSITSTPAMGGVPSPANAFFAGAAVDYYSLIAGGSTAQALLPQSGRPSRMPTCSHTSA